MAHAVLHQHAQAGVRGRLTCHTTPALLLTARLYQSTPSCIGQQTHRLASLCVLSRAANTSQPAGSDEPAGQAAADPAGQQQQGFWATLKSKLFGNQKLDRERIAALGLAGIATYGLISNINAGIMIAIAWTTITKTYGVTPLAAGMWPKFLVAYGGLWVGSHFLRPLRLSLAVALTPFFDAGLNNIRDRLHVPKAAAFAIMLVGVAAASLAFTGTAVWIAGGFNTTAAIAPSTA